MCVKAETFDGEEEVGWWTPDGRQTHVGPPQHWDRDQVLLLPGKVASLLLETVVNLLLEVEEGTLGRIENNIGDVWVPVGSV